MVEDSNSNCGRLLLLHPVVVVERSRCKWKVAGESSSKSPMKWVEKVGVGSYRWMMVVVERVRAVEAEMALGCNMRSTLCMRSHRVFLILEWARDWWKVA